LFETRSQLGLFHAQSLLQFSIIANDAHKIDKGGVALHHRFQF